MNKHPGITERNGRYRAEAYDKVTQRRVYKSFDTLTAAKAWRRDMQVKIAKGEARAVDPVTIREAWTLWLDAAERGVVRARGGEAYKPGVLASYSQVFKARPLKRFGSTKVGELRRAAVQRWVDELVAEGLAAQSVRNNVNALRVLMKWCIREELRHDNPCDGVELPSGGTERDRIAPPAEAVELLGALAVAQDRAIYATAFFAGLRRGELMGLRWEDVDLVERVVRVRQNWDVKTRQLVAPKSKAGVRELGIPELLVPYLAALDTTDGLVFRSATGGPFNHRALVDRATAAWDAAGLTPIGLHEARHTYASLMIAAGVNIKTISEWMGHSSVNITLDRYGHLLPGSAKVALGLLDAYLAEALA